MPRMGELEQAVMDHLWEDPSTPLSVREVHTRISAVRDIAYTTVLTVLDRLSKKHVVTRELDGRSWLYSPVRTRAQMVVDDILESIHAGGPRQRRELLEELFSRLSSDESLPPCAPLWAHITQPEVTPAGDRNGD
ncbi:BlaI/MecI/CopY family transcriptional regulator [Propionicicella superfundia]|uniref:BlaI/MecI/CopY family transcriptional regulator n=1 Tax=Propionicicella superfundia TaxID=348582 RepID=UPI00048ECA7D|nr:BlaI/MecI/CopY family transcriptional regulator [Propionicicella superfundia]